MTPKKTLRLGTRRSALAWVQSSQVAVALRAAHPGLEVELVGIDTRGDRVLDRPLSEMEGKEFFTAEIDQALREQRVDFTVHSLKDLSMDRPPEFVLAAVPERANPRDFALFAPDVPERLASGAGVVIGTSSPRRAELLPPFLAQALPHGARNRITLTNLRGNVDTRLRRLHEPRGSERHLDGVVLAFAGLSRLFADIATERQGQQLLTGLLQGLHYMVLPLTESPGAPGQGALAIECRADDENTRALLAALEDAATRGAITVERQLLAEHGGGCHQRFGATMQWLPGLGGLLRVAGRSSANHDIGDEIWVPEVRLEDPVGRVHAWDGSRSEPARAKYLMNGQELAARIQNQAVFAAHSRALPPDAADALRGKAVWTSGSKSWFQLASHGVWVQGCSEGLGAETAARLVAEPLLRLPPPSHWTVLTHEGAVDPWQAGAWSGAHVLATYALGETPLPDTAALASATHVFWSSTAQFERCRRMVAPSAHHASGPGKTAEHIRASGVRNFRPFPSAEEWRRWTAQAH
ncbi:MAG TPA: hydroxymethylbilane synthase [Steroidobacteraceae bacterium]|nr:hydroxymethylbilane synthase [Steroidobacteraceae bacterium]